MDSHQCCLLSSNVSALPPYRVGALVPPLVLQARADLGATKKRVKESEARIDSALEAPIKKSYW